MSDFSVSVSANVDVNQLTRDAASALDVHAAMIYNDSGKTVNFAIYNYSDVLNVVPLAQTPIANGYAGTIAGTGSAFKVYPDNENGTGFTVEPKKIYIYKGRGAITVV